MAPPRKKKPKTSFKGMATIRRLREARNISREDLAARIKATAAALAEWEKGAAQPSPSQLRSLAFEFGCQSEDLQGERKKDTPKIRSTTYYHFTDQEIEDGWWGHFGVKVPGCDQSKWYPITVGIADSISAQLADYEDSEKWIVVQTLNNRILVVNPLAARRLWVLDDAQDEPRGDWSTPIDGERGKPVEFYKALEQYPDREKPELRDCVAEEVETFTDVYDLGEDEVNQLLFDTHIHDRGGACTSYWVRASYLAELVEAIELAEPPRIMNLSCDSFESYFPSSTIVMIDMPRLLVLQEMERSDGEDEQDRS